LRPTPLPLPAPTPLPIPAPTPLPLPAPTAPPTPAGAAAFTPFLYGDHLWSLTTRFPENFGLGPLRPPREPETLAAVPRLS
ncbi:MAG: hypothetical protein QGF33_10760, partial [Alphaproteobacteria bacterium]|nr:hypothetical protein [Alphaproteobacteria bacterium]